mgnify:CR=1 FL=1
MIIEISLFGQDSLPTLLDTACARKPIRKIEMITALDFFATFAGIHILNGGSNDEQSNLHLYYNFTANNIIKAGPIRITNYFFTEFGMKLFFDSLSFISEDCYNFKNSFSYCFNNSKFALNVSICSKSQFFNHFNYRIDTLNRIERYLFTSYLSPGYIDYTGGIKIFFGDFFTLEFGLVNGRKTKILNQDIFKSRNAVFLYGLNKGESQKTDYGFNLVLNIMSKEIFHNIYWENFSQFNVSKENCTMIKYYQCNLNNAFHYRFLKYLRLSYRTQMLYDYHISLKPKFINTIALGFYLNNKQ